MSIKRTTFLSYLFISLVFISGCQDVANQTSTGLEVATPETPISRPTVPDIPALSPNFTMDYPSANGNNIDTPLGTNSTYIKDWTASWVFVDTFKASRPWVSASPSDSWDDGRELDLDSSGWVKSLLPDQSARTLMLDGKNGHYPAGDYIVLYDGEGQLSYSGDGHYNRERSQPGRHVVTVENPTSRGIYLTINETNPANYIRNIRVIMPGGVCSNDGFQWCADNSDCSNGAVCESFEDNYETQIFHPTFLKRIRRFSAYRFMNWMRTNGSEQSTWANRPKPTDARWSTDKGVPLEVMINFANRMNMDPWFNIPHLADDDYVRRFAEMVRDNLDPDLKVYVEHSNEVWNGMFRQTHYATARGKELGLADDITGDQGRIDSFARLRYHSLRSVQIFDIFESVFGGTSRLVRVMGSHTRNAWNSRQLLEYRNAYLKTDALAIAPYFGGYLGRVLRGNTVLASRAGRPVAEMTVDELLDVLENESIPEALADIATNAQLANEFGVDLVAYEGGQHLVRVRNSGDSVTDSKIDELFMAANRHPRMEQLYTTYLEGWRDNGGKLYMNFVNISTFNRYGSWGNLEYQDQPASTAPKYRAVMDFIDNNTPRWW